MTGMGQNTSSPAFSSFPIMFFKVLFVRVIKTWDCVAKSKLQCLL